MFVLYCSHTQRLDSTFIELITMKEKQFNLDWYYFFFLHRFNYSLDL